MTSENGVNNNTGELSPCVAKIFGINIEEKIRQHKTSSHKSSNNDRYAWSIWQTSPEPHTLPLPPSQWFERVSCS